MAIPASKDPAIEKLADSLTLNGSRTTCIKCNVCTWCGGPASEFKDDLSRKEYTISGFCQKCQDKTFGE